MTNGSCKGTHILTLTANIIATKVSNQDVVYLLTHHIKIIGKEWARVSESSRSHEYAISAEMALSSTNLSYVLVLMIVLIVSVT